MGREKKRLLANKKSISNDLLLPYRYKYPFFMLNKGFFYPLIDQSAGF